MQLASAYGSQEFSYFDQRSNAALDPRKQWEHLAIAAKWRIFENQKRIWPKPRLRDSSGYMEK